MITSNTAEWIVVWGFASTSREVGELARFSDRQQAEAYASAWEQQAGNSACGAWVRPVTEE